ncbi:MAG: PepSY-like domain-containing protein [Chloroflexota bacterium]
MSEENELEKSVEVPEAVLNAFAALYPNIAPEWSEEDGGYEAEFEKDGKGVEINFLADGTLVQTEIELDLADVPDAVIKAAKAKYPESEIDEVELVELPDGTIHYEVDMGDMELHIMSDGEIIDEDKDL